MRCKILPAIAATRNRRSTSSIRDLIPPQAFDALIYGAHEEREEREHVSFTQNALYCKINYTHDLSLYPEGAIVGEPRLFVVSKLPGRDFDCCALADAKEGQTFKPNQRVGQQNLAIREFRGQDDRDPLAG